MNKIIYLNIPAFGHVNPTLPVVQELAKRGEQVIYYNTDEFRPQIERTGATFRAYPASALTSGEIATALEGGNISNISVLLLRVAETLTPFVLDEFEREKPDLVIYDATVLWGKIAARKLNLRRAASISIFIVDLKAGKFSGARSRR